MNELGDMIDFEKKEDDMIEFNLRGVGELYSGPYIRFEGPDRTRVEPKDYSDREGYVGYIDFGFDNMSYKTDDDDEDVMPAAPKETYGFPSKPSLSLYDDGERKVWVLS